MILFLNGLTLDVYKKINKKKGMVSLFAGALPIMLAIAILNNVFESWIDLQKLTKHSRRPEPRSAVGIGTWLYVLQFLGKCQRVCLHSKISFGFYWFLRSIYVSDYKHCYFNFYGKKCQWFDW